MGTTRRAGSCPFTPTSDQLDFAAVDFHMHAFQDFDLSVYDLA
jgi:hypothetical protein